jgi:hypothetical protein
MKPTVKEIDEVFDEMKRLTHEYMRLDKEDTELKIKKEKLHYQINVLKNEMRELTKFI